MIRSVTLLGSSSGRNAGDAALPSGIMDSIDVACGKPLLYEIPTIKPSFIRKTYLNDVKPISMLPWSLSVKMLGLPTFNSIMRTDISLIFDAILFDRSLFNPLFNHLSTLYLMLPYAKKRGKKIGLYNVGVGPLNTPLGKKMMREIAEICDIITVRDLGSYNILKEIGVKNPRILLTADAALNVTSSPEARIQEILTKHGLAGGEEMLALNVSKYLDSWAGTNRQPMQRERFIEVYSAAINKVIAEINLPIVFIGTQHHDLPLTKAIMSKLNSSKNVALIDNLTYNHFEIKGVLSKVSLLFGMRLHSLILASANCTPICGLPHQPKVTYYLETVGLEEYNLSFDNFSEESIASHVLNSWHNRKQIRAQLESVIPKLKRESFKAAQLVAALDRGEDLDKTLQHLKNADGSSFLDQQRSALKVG